MHSCMEAVGTGPGGTRNEELMDIPPFLPSTLHLPDLGPQTHTGVASHLLMFFPVSSVRQNLLRLFAQANAGLSFLPPVSAFPFIES